MPSGPLWGWEVEEKGLGGLAGRAQVMPSLHFSQGAEQRKRNPDLPLGRQVSCQPSEGTAGEGGGTRARLGQGREEGRFCFLAHGLLCRLWRQGLPGNTAGHRPSSAVATPGSDKGNINREIQVSKGPSGSLATGAEVGQCPHWAPVKAARHCRLP